MSELNKIYGLGNIYQIGDKEYEVFPVKNKDIKKVLDLHKKMHPIVTFNYMDREEIKDGDTVIQEKVSAKQGEKIVYELLDIATGSKHTKEELGELNVDEVEQIIKFFLYGKRANIF